jgi:sterile alpha motif and leucine zipper-containing kinase AZK
MTHFHQIVKGSALNATEYSYFIEYQRSQETKSVHVSREYTALISNTPKPINDPQEARFAGSKMMNLASVHDHDQVANQSSAKPDGSDSYDDSSDNGSDISNEASRVYDNQYSVMSVNSVMSINSEYEELDLALSKKDISLRSFSFYLKGIVEREMGPMNTENTSAASFRNDDSFSNHGALLNHASNISVPFFFTSEDAGMKLTQFLVAPDVRTAELQGYLSAAVQEFNVYRFLVNDFSSRLKAFACAAAVFAVAVGIFDLVNQCGIFSGGDSELYSIKAHSGSLENCVASNAAGAALVTALLLLSSVAPAVIQLVFYPTPSVMSIHSTLANSPIRGSLLETEMRGDFVFLRAVHLNMVSSAFIASLITMSFYIMRSRQLSEFETMAPASALSLDPSLIEHFEYRWFSTLSQNLRSAGLLLVFLPFVYYMHSSAGLLGSAHRVCILTLSAVVWYLIIHLRTSPFFEIEHEGVPLSLAYEIATVSLSNTNWFVVICFATWFLARANQICEWVDRIEFSFSWNSRFPRFCADKSLEAGQTVDVEVRSNFNKIENLLSDNHDVVHEKLRLPIMFDQLEYVTVIGKGSNASVYLARHRDNIVAVKELDIGKCTLRDMIGFLAEMELLANLSHANIIRFERMVLDFPKMCSVMEYAKSGSLRETLVASPFLDWRNEKRNFAYSIADGMHYLHSLYPPVLHRDLKTMNVLVTEWQGIKISDFGDARLNTRWSGDDNAVKNPSQPSSSDQNAATDFVGTSLFMAPEVMRSERFTKACDVYSFGCVLVDLVVGGKLKDLYFQSFGSEYTEAKFHQAVSSGWRPELPPYFCKKFSVLEKVITQCWDHDPAKRPQFRELVSFFDQWDGMEEIGEVRPYAKYTTTGRYTLGVDLSAAESAFIGEGIKVMFDKMNRSNPLAIMNGLSRGFGSSVFTKTLQCNAREVCDYAFNFLHPDRSHLAYEAGDEGRKLIAAINENHHILWSRVKIPLPGTYLRDFVVRQMWQEVSQGNFFIHCKSSGFPFVPPYSGNVVVGEVQSILWAKQNLDGESCECAFSVSVNLKGAFPSATSHLQDVVAKMASFLDHAEAVIANCESWGPITIDPEHVCPFFGNDGLRLERPASGSNSFCPTPFVQNNEDIQSAMERVVTVDDDVVDRELRGMKASGNDLTSELI